MAHTLDAIDYQEVRDFLPPEAQKYLDHIEDEFFRTWALNRYTRLLYTNEELRCHYNQLRALGYTPKQAVRLRYLAPARLHRILNQEIIVMFFTDASGKPTDRYQCTINNSDSQALNNFRNIDKVYIKANGRVRNDNVKRA
jgi:hypothetical protein